MGSPLLQQGELDFSPAEEQAFGGDSEVSVSARPGSAGLQAGVYGKSKNCLSR